jgi:hypothetical protein
VLVELTPKGFALLEESPPLLQERFIQRFSCLEEWEQTQLLASLQRIASMMDAEDIDASPVLSSGSMVATPEAVEEVVVPQSTTGDTDGR